jgi:SAM-dependent methyltransferase
LLFYLAENSNSHAKSIIDRVAIAVGARRSPNIWDHPQVYELENRAVDPDARLLDAMRSTRDWAGQTVLDIGCGTGFYLPMFAETAARVIGVEPHGSLVDIARRRCRTRRSIEIRHGIAQRLPVADTSIDVMHARWAYFLGPGCEPGLAELDRVMRHGGTAYVIDNDATWSTFGSWFRRAKPEYDPSVIERFWSSRGWSRTSVDVGWRFERRADFEAVIRIEFDADNASRIIADYQSTVEPLSVDYAVNLWHRGY